jgi:hypothetical protein
MPFFHIRSEFSCLYIACVHLFMGLVTWVFPTGGLFLGQGEKIFENEHARQSVVESQLWNLNE